MTKPMLLAASIILLGGVLGGCGDQQTNNSNDRGTTGSSPGTTGSGPPSSSPSDRASPQNAPSPNPAPTGTGTGSSSPR